MQATYPEVRATVRSRAGAFLSALERPAVQASIPVVFLVLVIAGTWRGFSAVPFWDMWDGAVWFYLAVRDGVDGQFLAQHNEHRIVFSKILFWLDLHVFGARSYLLLPANVGLGILVWMAFCGTARPLIRDDGHWKIVCCALAALSLSWMQSENFVWAFQSQFLVAVLFPLAAFAYLAMSARAPRFVPWFIGALVFGAASLGTMVNGLLVFPLLVAMQVVLARVTGRISWGRVLVLTVSGGVLTALWFRGFALGSDGVTPTPADFVLFAATFMGDPLGHISGHVAGGVMGGVAFAGVVLALAILWWRQGTQLHPMFLGLLAMIAFIGGTCLMVSYGRAAIAHDASMISRYATPSLAAWCACLILGAAVLQTRPRAQAIFARTSAALALVLLPIQFQALNGEGPLARQERMHGALALVLGVYDPEALRKIYLSKTRDYYLHVKTAADRLAAMNRSIFADPAWNRITARIGGPIPDGWRACTGAVERMRAIPGEDRFRGVDGWAIDKERLRQPRLIYFAVDGRVVGLAMSGAPRPDVAAVMGWRGRRGGFNGFVAADANGDLAVLCPGTDDAMADVPG